MAVATSQRTRARVVADRGEIAAFLRRDRLYAAYALGDLDGANRGRIAWAMAYDDAGRATALVMHHEGLVPQPLFLMGAPDGCRAILEQRPQAARRVLPGHRAARCGPARAVRARRADVDAPDGRRPRRRSCRSPGLPSG